MGKTMLRLEDREWKSVALIYATPSNRRNTKRAYEYTGPSIQDDY